MYFHVPYAILIIKLIVAIKNAANTNDHEQIKDSGISFTLVCSNHCKTMSINLMTIMCTHLEVSSIVHIRQNGADRFASATTEKKMRFFKYDTTSSV
jgi:hypothetical protein